MFIKNLFDCESITGGDGTYLRELLSPSKDGVQLRYSLAHAVVKPGETTYWHRMRTSEVYYFLSGNGVMYIENEERDVTANHLVYIPPNSRQRVKNTGTEDLIFLCIVDPEWKPEDEEIFT